MKVLIDTNVVMDALEGAGEFFDASNKAIEICARKLATGYLAAHSITNLFYLLRKRFSNDECRDILLDLFNIFQVEQIDSHKLRTALENREFKDFEDCLQMECAKSTYAELIVTRDKRFMADSSVRCITPMEFCGMFQDVLAEFEEGRTEK